MGVQRVRASHDCSDFTPELLLSRFCTRLASLHLRSNPLHRLVNEPPDFCKGLLQVCSNCSVGLFERFGLFFVFLRCDRELFRFDVDGLQILLEVLQLRLVGFFDRDDFKFFEFGEEQTLDAQELVRVETEGC